MVEDKVGTKDYLGITIDYDKEKNFDKFSLDTLKDRYFWDGETHAQEAFARASVFGATFRGETDYEMAQRLLSVVSLIMFLTVGLGYLLTMTRTYGWQVQVEALVDIGEMLGVTVYLLLMALVLLVQFHSCMW